MMTHDEMIAVIQHHKDGGEVQFYAYNEPDTLYIGDDIIWNFNRYFYRPYVEPKSKQIVTIEKWLAESAFEGYLIIEGTKEYIQDFSNVKVKLLSTRDVEID